MNDNVQQTEVPEVKYRMRYLTPEVETAIIAAYQEGLPIAEIMQDYGVSRGTVYNVLKRTAKKNGGEENDTQEENAK